MPGHFIDMDVLVYFAAHDTAKADRAEKIVAEGGTISVQTLNGLANVARRKMRMSWWETRTLLSTIRALLLVQSNTVDIHEAGLVLAERHNLLIDDAMITASALHADCDTLWSEDMHDGMVVQNRLHIYNPFRTAS
ncbi:PIN domain-containing protein [Acidiferrobacter sp.]|uniref:PIN domain-containing protein n=1 Tax=Acidiferrobacter sp. TaxID=1872107 RepID=UPI002601F3A1|nr:PIN domain-containing protein [Acidiferrobacter sp.]